MIYFVTFFRSKYIAMVSSFPLIKGSMSCSAVSRTIPAFSSIHYLGSFANIALNLFTLASNRVRSDNRADSEGNLSAVRMNSVASLPVKIGVLRIGLAIMIYFFVSINKIKDVNHAHHHSTKWYNS